MLFLRNAHDCGLDRVLVDEPLHLARVDERIFFGDPNPEGNVDAPQLLLGGGGRECMSHVDRISIHEQSVTLEHFGGVPKPNGVTMRAE